MTLNFEKYAQSGKEFVKKVAFELGDDNDLDRAGRVLRSTLQVLRDQSTPQECVQLLNQLPMLIKALIVDGWTPGKTKGRVRHYDDFVTEVHRRHRATYKKHDLSDFIDQDDCHQSVQAVLRVITDYVSEGEIKDFCATLPADLRELFS